MASSGGRTPADKVKLPALALMISTAVFLVIYLAIFIFAPAMLSGLTDYVNKIQAEQAAKTGTAPPAPIPESGRNYLFFILAMAGGGFIIFGALKMRNLESWGIALAASVVSIVPCTTPCCCTGMPIGIWALIVLLNSDVKAAFRS